ncbi:MAG: 2-hydroxy-3-keto-5-methylthiopentenyl-1-phosphate phosphatase [Dehalococcoidia bacterium]|nr:2-hydroxy-3-keto-5-methylthiopentenyl-1-phosphate phosphatase [Dehalococcoidia bacterium]
MLSIVCDFDGTITMDDMAVAMLTAFAIGDWERWDDEFAAGRITIEECLVKEFAHVAASRRELTEYAVAHARIRPGFPEFLDFCASSNIALTVASAGLEFYIKAILGKAGVKAPELVCGKARFSSGGLRVSFAHLKNKNSEGYLDLKEQVVERLHQEGLEVAYIGDGRPDFPAAQRADLVFARGRLAELCDRADIKYWPFVDFHDVMAVIAKTPVVVQP